jgi:hypothetical protein
MSKTKLQMGDLKQVATCTLVHYDAKLSYNWPVFLIDGFWGLTPSPHWESGKPDLESEWVAITHLPSGKGACYVRIDDPQKVQKLAKIAGMFRGVGTETGVMRKWRKLSKAQKRWVNNQVPWLLPKQQVRQ